MISRQLDHAVTERLKSERREHTYADVLAVPDHQVAELIDGELIVSPRPAIRHARASSRLGARLETAFGGRPDDTGWIILDEPELHFPREGKKQNVVVPDLVGWRVARFPFDQADANYLRVSPDWVCEVISPRTERVDRGKKAGIYARGGVGYLWFVNPILRTLEVMRLTNGHWLQLAVYADDEQIHPEPFDELPFDLSALWLLTPRQESV